MHNPKPATAKSNIFPCFLRRGKIESVRITHIEPISVAAFSIPKPCEPTFKISLAKIGISATIPPKSTANKSNVTAPRMVLFLKI